MTDDATRRRLMAALAKPSPRGTGRGLEVKITLYDGGHGAVSAPHALPLLSNNDQELVGQLTLLIRNMRGE